MDTTNKEKGGLKVIKDNLALVSIAQEGIEASYFVLLQMHWGLRKDELAGFIGIDAKTVDNYRNSKKKFTKDAAEKILQLHRLFALGDELFGTTAEFGNWLKIPLPGLENRSPIELLHSISGIAEVEKQLLRIAHGYAA